MRQDKKTFTHLSLQDVESIQPLLTSISDGLAHGTMVFSDDDDEIVLTPKGLLQLKVSASTSTTKHQMAIKISWNVNNPELDEKSILSILPAKNNEK